MGRRKLSMDLIAKEKDRLTTFRKRQKGLKKKAFEFSTLCDVDACVIILGPKQPGNVGPVTPETWPEDPAEVRRIIERFKNLPKEERERHSLGLGDFLVGRKKKTLDELAQLRQKNNNETQYPKFLDQLNNFYEEQLSQLCSDVDSKLAEVNTRIDWTKKQKLQEEMAGMIEYYTNPSKNCNPFPDLVYLPYEYHSWSGMMDDGVLNQQVLSHHPLPVGVFHANTMMTQMIAMNGSDDHSGPTELCQYPLVCPLTVGPCNQRVAGPSNTQPMMPSYFPYAVPGFVPMQMHHPSHCLLDGRVALL
uniref:MADS-box domain-containing protein n=1 Tax=Nelumbo nucifera TaxID=4432 RepID=A0A822YIN2_NELNU|nr:TPA_asm: hypothetical protein HUJ06_011291 [Nelumbo nucifera]